MKKTIVLFIMTLTLLTSCSSGTITVSPTPNTETERFPPFVPPTTYKYSEGESYGKANSTSEWWYTYTNPHRTDETYEKFVKSPDEAIKIAKKPVSNNDTIDYYLNDVFYDTNDQVYVVTYYPYQISGEMILGGCKHFVISDRTGEIVATFGCE